MRGAVKIQYAGVLAKQLKHRWALRRLCSHRYDSDPRRDAVLVTAEAMWVDEVTEHARSPAQNLAILRQR